MIIISWNCRGLKNPRTVHDLCLLVQDKKPNIVFLMETKLDMRRMDGVRKRLGFYECLIVDAISSKGGLAILWRIEGYVQVFNYSQNHISMMVNDFNTNFL